MNILVYNLAAEYGGALTVLSDFYNEVKNYSDKNIHWYFVVTTNILENTDNITVIQVPNVKKSWFHRWAYDSFSAPKLIKKYNIDKVFSMQNMGMKNCNVEQTVYLHQSLQFSPVRYSLLRKEERKYAVRQKLICSLINVSLKDVDKIIVQTKWMKDATVNWIKSSKPQYYTIYPKINLNVSEKVSLNNYSYNTFFYPAGDGLHKNHDAIIDACILLEKEKIKNYKVIFTLDKDGSEYNRRLYKRVRKYQLNIDFIGYLDVDTVYEYYKETILLFPSYLETVGYPLIEAKEFGTIIFASDLPFVHEALAGYKNIYYFQYDKPMEIKELIKRSLKNQIKLQYNDMNEFYELEDFNIVDVILK